MKYANANGALATISSAKAIVNGVEETLVKDTDYELGKENIGDCTLVTLLAGGVLTEADMATTKIIITYTITPDTTAKYFTHYVNSLAKPFKMLLINEYEWNGNKRYILQYVDNCQANKAVIAQIADSDNTTAGMPLEITGEIINEKYKGFVTT
ncbi:MAG: hypothetical protein LBU27_08880 [Candidatus Peribacteria bacterium]|nr:hypothetical protein [Candidatus Peribacteria bacterium]